MYYELILKSFVIGLIMALPTGPVGMISIRRALSFGFKAGLASGVASSLADVPYIALARIGVTGFSRQLLAQRHWLSVLTFAIVVCVGVKLLKNSGPAPLEATTPVGHGKMFASAFLLTISNPTVLLTSAALFAAAGMPATSGWPATFICVSASLVGSVILWAGLSVALDRPRTTLSQTGFVRLSRFTGLAVVVLAAVGLIAA